MNVSTALANNPALAMAAITLALGATTAAVEFVRAAWQRLSQQPAPASAFARVASLLSVGLLAAG